MNPCPHHDHESNYPVCSTCPPPKGYKLGELLREITERYPMPVVYCRLYTGARIHTGYLTRSHGESYFARVRDDKRGPRSQYQGVMARHLEGGRFEVKVGNRYVPFTEDVYRDHLGGTDATA